MNKVEFKPGNMLYPLPAVLVSVADKEGRDNLITVVWTGTICSDPAMVYISVRKERFSHHMLMESKEFVINLTTKELAKATDYCGVQSGAKVDKFKEMHLNKGKAKHLEYVPIVVESPVNIECKVTEVLPLGSHDMFIGQVVGVQVSQEYLNEANTLLLNEANLLAYCHGSYRELGKKIDTFGFSVRKKRNRKKKKRK